MSIRFDRSTLGITKEPYRTDDGLLLCEASLCRAGVLEYKQPNGNVIRELRPAEENERAIAEMGVLPVGIEHPASLVNQDSAQTYRKGISLQNVRLGKGGYVTADIAVWDKELQRMIESGEKREVSLGYRCDIKDEPGVWRDDSGVEHRYDRIQTNLRPNHIAVTSKARAGETVRIHMDSADGEDFAVMITEFDKVDAPRADGCGCDGGDCDCPSCKGKKKKGETRMNGDKKMVKMSFDMGEGMSEEYEVPEGVATAMQKKMDRYRSDSEALLLDLEDKDEAIAALTAQIEELAGIQEHNTEVFDELQEKFDSLVEELEEIEEAIEELDDEDRMDSEDFDLDELVEATIEARWDAYEAVAHLIPGKEFDYLLDAEEWAVRALEANGIELDEDERLDSDAVAIALRVLDTKQERMDATQSLRDRMAQFEQQRFDSDGDRFDSEDARARMIAESRGYGNKSLSEIYGHSI